MNREGGGGGLFLTQIARGGPPPPLPLLLPPGNLALRLIYVNFLLLPRAGERANLQMSAHKSRERSV